MEKDENVLPMITDERIPPMPLVTPKKDAPRIENINKFVDKEILKILDDIDIVSSDFDAMISILKDRMIESTDASFPIALARLGELRMDGIKKKVDILKIMVTDKSVEMQAKKRNTSGDLESILSGAGLGMMLGARMGQSNYSQPVVIENTEFETVNTNDAEIVLDPSERLNTGNSLQESDISGLLGE